MDKEQQLVGELGRLVESHDGITRSVGVRTRTARNHTLRPNG